MPSGEKRVVVATAGLTAGAVLVSLLAIVFTDVERLVPGVGPDCWVGATDLTQQEAEELTTAVARGRRPALEKASLVCRSGGSEESEANTLSRRGLTARAEAVRRDLESTFGRQRLGGFAPGGVTSGHQVGSAHYEGRAIDVFFRPITPANKARGWVVAQYLVAHAARLEIDTVIFDGRIWTARRSVQGWREYDVDTAGVARRTARILEHRDHVHVDVAD